MAQETSDTYETEGLVYTGAYVIADVMIGKAVTSGISKATGTGAGAVDDIGDIANKADDVADVAETAGKMDDVAEMAGKGGKQYLLQIMIVYIKKVFLMRIKIWLCLENMMEVEQQVI